MIPNKRIGKNSKINTKILKNKSDKKQCNIVYKMHPNRRKNNAVE